VEPRASTHELDEIFKPDKFPEKFESLLEEHEDWLLVLKLGKPDYLCLDHAMNILSQALASRLHILFVCPNEAVAEYPILFTMRWAVTLSSEASKTTQDIDNICVARGLNREREARNVRQKQTRRRRMTVSEKKSLVRALVIMFIFYMIIFVSVGSGLIN
jgi:hypothetical protein